MKKLFFVLLIVFSYTCLFAEIIYQKDGQVIKGTIIKENRTHITVKTRYQVRKIRRNRIKRILYGNREMERIHILMKDGSSIRGFLVDQDSVRVYLRKSKESSKEITVLKKDIDRMSSDEIIPFDFAISVRMGLYIPIDSGGSSLSPAPMFIAGFGFNFPWIKRTRILLEGAYVKSDSSVTAGQYIRVIPVTLSGCYEIPFFFLKIVPKVGVGGAYIQFDEGDGAVENGARDVAEGFGVSFLGGAGLRYDIVKRKFFISAWGEYNLLYDGSTTMSNVIVSGGLSYRF
ncbi:MAG: hypothetical protein GY754_26350 [bacterium]|nr:hypothetical protein [bacterium]